MKTYHTKFGDVEVDGGKEWWKGYAYIKRKDLLPDYPDYFMPYESPDGEIADLPDLDSAIYYDVAEERRILAPQWFIQTFWEGGEYDGTEMWVCATVMEKESENNESTG